MTEEEFDAAVMAAPVLIDNAGTWHPLGHLEGDRCACGTRIPGDVDCCEECWLDAEWGAA